MAIMHMLQNEEIESDRKLNSGGIRRSKKKLRAKALCLVGGIALVCFIIRKWLQIYDAQLGERILERVDYYLSGKEPYMLSYSSSISDIFIFLINCILVFNIIALRFIVYVIIYVIVSFVGSDVAVLPIILITSIGILVVRFLPKSSSKSDQERMHEKGKEGEQIAMHQLKTLPDQYHVFDNLQFEYRNSNGELRPGEADFLIVGPTGLHLVEIKNWTGTISTGSSNKVVKHTKTVGANVEEKSPFYQAMSNSGKFGGQLRHFTKRNLHVNANVLFTNDSLNISMLIPDGCSAYKIGNQVYHQSLTRAICEDTDSMLTDDDVELIVDTILYKIWKPKYSAEVLRYLGDLD